VNPVLPLNPSRRDEDALRFLRANRSIWDAWSRAAAVTYGGDENVAARVSVPAKHMHSVGRIYRASTVNQRSRRCKSN
jgi:hypothetical protein